MKLVKFNSIREGNFQFSSIKSVAQSFENELGWTGYESTPRPNNGLIFIVGDTEFIYKTKSETCFTARKGDIVFAPKGSTYRVDFKKKERETAQTISYTVNFSLADEKGESVGVDMPLCILARDASLQFLRRVAALDGAYRDIKHSKILVLSHFLGLLDSVIDTLDGNVDAYYPIRRGVEALRCEWRENHPISRYAELCSMSETGFRGYFKRWAGMSPVQYRNRMRIAAAKSLFEDGSVGTVTVSRVAEMTGFEDSFYFSRVFKSITGVSPQKFAKG